MRYYTKGDIKYNKNMARAIIKETDDKSSDEKSSEGTSNDEKTSDGSSSDGSSSDGSSSDGTSSNGKSSDEKSGDGTSSDEKSNDEKSNDETSNDGTSNDGKSSKNKAMGCRISRDKCRFFETRIKDDAAILGKVLQSMIERTSQMESRMKKWLLEKGETNIPNWDEMFEGDDFPIIDVQMNGADDENQTGYFVDGQMPSTTEPIDDDTMTDDDVQAFYAQLCLYNMYNCPMPTGEPIYEEQ